MECKLYTPHPSINILSLDVTRPTLPSLLEREERQTVKWIESLVITLFALVDQFPVPESGA